MKTKRRPFRNTGVGNDLEWYIENFKETCEVCKQELLVHAFRQGSLKYKKAVYGACHNKSCRNQMIVICFYVI